MRIYTCRDEVFYVAPTTESDHRSDKQDNLGTFRFHILFVKWTHIFQMNGPTVHSCTVALLIFFKKIRVFTSLNHILQLDQFCGHLCNSTAYIILHIR